MRKVVVMACLFSVTLTGCATRPPELIPAGVNREELAATIARQGQASPLEPDQPMGPPLRPPPGKLDQFEEDTRRMLIITAVGVGIGLGIVAYVVLAALASKYDSDNNYSTPPAPPKHR